MLCLIHHSFRYMIINVTLMAASIDFIEPWIMKLANSEASLIIEIIHY